VGTDAIHVTTVPLGTLTFVITKILVLNSNWLTLWATYLFSKNVYAHHITKQYGRPQGGGRNRYSPPGKWVLELKNFRKPELSYLIPWSSLLDICCLWRHNMTSYSRLQTNILAVCWHNMHNILHTLYLLVVVQRATVTNISAGSHKTRANTALNAKTEQFITAKISGNALKHGSRTHSVPRQRSLQLHNLRLRIETVEWNTLSATAGHFTTTKTPICANVSSNTEKVCRWDGGHQGLTV